MGMLNRLGDLHQIAGCYPTRNRAIGKATSEAHSFDKVHAEIRASVDLPDLMNRHDVRVSEGCGGLCLGFETLKVTGARYLARENHLQRDHALQPYLAGFENNPHAAPP